MPFKRNSRAISEVTEKHLIYHRLRGTKNLLGWNTLAGRARKWWLELEKLNKHQMHLVLELAEELAKRRSSIYEFYLASSYSNYISVDENLRYLDSIRQDKSFSESKSLSQEKAVYH